MTEEILELDALPSRERQQDRELGPRTFLEVGSAQSCVSQIPIPQGGLLEGLTLSFLLRPTLIVRTRLHVS